MENEKAITRVLDSLSDGEFLHFHIGLENITMKAPSFRRQRREPHFFSISDIHIWPQRKLNLVTDRRKMSFHRSKGQNETGNCLISIHTGDVSLVAKITMSWYFIPKYIFFILPRRTFWNSSVCAYQTMGELGQFVISHSPKISLLAEFHAGSTSPYVCSFLLQYQEHSPGGRGKRERERGVKGQYEVPGNSQ